MFINKLNYSECVRDSHWTLKDFTFGPTNLIVGQNTAGKTRTLNVIAGLANIILGRRQVSNGHFTTTFIDSSNTSYEYELNIDKEHSSEKLTVGKDEKISKNINGKGTIDYSELNQKLKFQIPTDKFAISVKRDLLQHPFIEPMHHWAQSLRHYKFAKGADPNQLIILNEDFTNENNAQTPESPAILYHTFLEGKKNYNDIFVKSIIDDMNTVGYAIEDVDLEPVPDVKTNKNIPGVVSGFSIFEKGCEGKIYQHNMSQGMFRTLSIIIHMNFLSLTQSPGCILIDDVGEGLDFKRSCSLIQLLIEKSKKQNTQLIMTTNDRFIMNAVPLEYWIIIEREGGTCNTISQTTHPDIFEEFKFTGLNNFDFFATEFWKEYMSKEVTT